MRATSCAQLVVEDVDRPRARAQHGIAVLAHLRERDAARARRPPGPAAAGPRPPRPRSLRPGPLPSPQMLLRVDVHAEARRRGARGPPRRPPPRRATSAIASWRSRALTTTCERSRPRRRNSGAGPSAPGPSPDADRGGRGVRGARAGRTPRRSGSASRTAGSCSASRRRSSSAVNVSASWRAASRIAGASGATSAPARARAVPRPARPGELGDERERPLLGAEVREPQRAVGVEHHAELDVREVVALGDDLRADEHAAVGRQEAREHLAGVLRRRRRAGRRRRPRRAIRARAARSRRRGGRSRRRRTTGSARGTGSRWPQWWHASAFSARCRTSVTSHSGHSNAWPQDRQVRKFDQPRRLSSTIALRASTSASCVRGCSVPFAARMSMTSTGGSGRPSTRSGSRTRRRRCADSQRGVAEPQTSSPSPARRSATRRAS